MDELEIPETRETVTWLVEGEALHRDSLGTEQVIRPGQLDLMTAGHGVSHSEEGTHTYRGALHDLQLWIAQPCATRDGPAAFEHHRSLPHRDLDAGEATALVGDLDGTVSPARRDTEHPGVDLSLREGNTTVPPRGDFEHALVTLAGAVVLDEKIIGPGHRAYLGTGRAEILEVYRTWMDRDDRFGRVASTLPHVEVAPPPWGR